MYFSIDDMGQITVGMGAMLDHEAEKSTYMVTVTATDDSDAPNNSASIAVTINVTNVNEAPMFAEATADRSIDENSAEDMAVGDPVMAMDADGDTLTYTLSGAHSRGRTGNGHGPRCRRHAGILAERR
jgi:hypothetical protein